MSRHERQRHGRCTRGFTLIELMVALGMAVVLATLAVPSFSAWLARSHLRNATERLRAELDQARSEALQRDAVVVVSFSRSIDGSWCYGLSIDTDCDCRQADAGGCFLDRDLRGEPLPRRVDSGQFAGVTMTAAPARPLRFSPVRPNLQASSVSFDAAGWTTRVITADLGRVRSCSPAGAAHLHGYDPC